MTTQRKILGKYGEELAVDYLKRQGYRILERNFRNRLGEIDIIAKDHDTICFVEVKTRVDVEFGSPLEAISKRKQFKLAQLALSYLKFKHSLDAKARFDVVTITEEEEGDSHIELLKNAFDLTDMSI